jgi:hypothetical protein
MVCQFFAGRQDAKKILLSAGLEIWLGFFLPAPKAKIPIYLKDNRLLFATNCTGDKDLVWISSQVSTTGHMCHSPFKMNQLRIYSETS